MPVQMIRRRTSGLAAAKASALAAATPTTRLPMSPGPAVTAMPSTSPSVSPGAAERIIDCCRQQRHMSPARNLRHDAAVFLMEGILVGRHVGRARCAHRARPRSRYRRKRSRCRAVSSARFDRDQRGRGCALASFSGPASTVNPALARQRFGACCQPTSGNRRVKVVRPGPGSSSVSVPPARWAALAAIVSRGPNPGFRGRLRCDRIARRFSRCRRQRHPGPRRARARCPGRRRATPRRLRASHT